jgi:hypothetical protein
LGPGMGSFCGWFPIERSPGERDFGARVRRARPARCPGRRYWGEAGFFRIQMHGDNLGIEHEGDWGVPYVKERAEAPKAPPTRAPSRCRFAPPRIHLTPDPLGGATHTAPSKYHDEIISLVFIHTKDGVPIVIMVFRCAIQKALCLAPPDPLTYPVPPCLTRRCDGTRPRTQEEEAPPVRVRHAPGAVRFALPKKSRVVSALPHTVRARPGRVSALSVFL